MKKVVFISALIMLSWLSHAQDAFQEDSISNYRLEEIVVSAVRAGKNTPVAYSNVLQSQIKKENGARNVPVLLQTIPSLVSFTEDGLGIGNTSLRIRGTDATRINVTLNGMPLNNPESQEVFWVNLPDISSSLQSIQVQRGIGTSTNGAAAFGASISMKTAGQRSEAYGEASTAIGSYNTFSSSLAAGTGILDNGLSVDARYSKNLGDGYIRNGKINHDNLLVSLSHNTDKQILKLSYIRGEQVTGITWVGISPDEMEKYGRKYNPAGKYKDDAGNTHYYDNETDNYLSNILQLMLTREISDNWLLNSSLSYNNGYGYYENYRAKNEFSSFGLKPQTINEVEYSRTDFIRRKMMSNNFYVANLSFNYKKNATNLTFGGMYSLYDGEHFGRLPWIKHSENIKENYEWYRNNGTKGEASIFTKLEYQLNDKLSLFGDVQYRHIYYNMSGIDDDLMDITSKFRYNFFNPKAGIFYNIDNNNSLYASVAMSSREPLRDDLKNSIKKNTVNSIKPESMIDYEAGYKYTSYNGLSLGVNIYYMDYNNQMVQTGKLNEENGYKMMENVKHSYRTGIEIEASFPIIQNKLHLDANATLSQNKIKDYTAYYDVIDNLDDYKWLRQESDHIGKTNISYSPDVVGMASISYQPTKDLSFNLLGKYVGKQYLDNTSNDEKSIPSYFTGNLSAGYTFAKTEIGTISLQLFANNIFNSKYIANGWASTEIFNKEGTYNWIGYYPQATRNYMIKATINF